MLYPGEIVTCNFVGVMPCDNCNASLVVQVRRGGKIPTLVQCSNCNFINQTGSFREILNPKDDLEGKYTLEDLIGGS